MNDADRRRLLKFLLASPALYPPAAGAFWFFGDKEETRPRQINTWKGSVSVNATPLSPDTIIKPGDTIETGDNSELVFILGKDAHLLRSNTRLTLGNNNGLVHIMRLVSGAMLSVFGSGEKHIHTPAATIGIRGTGTYFEVTDNETYLCTCYGETEISAKDDPSVAEKISTRHHGAPRFIRRSGEGTRIEAAPVRNHTDAELIMLEATVGREPPFTSEEDSPFSRDGY